MATPRSTTYNTYSGGGIFAGIAGGLVRPPSSPVTGTIFFIGDSITEENYGCCPWVMALAMLGGNAPKIVQNSGHAGQSISGLISQIDLSYVDLAGGPMGLVGMTPTGWGFLRIGTNNVRGAEGSTGVPLDGGMQADYVALITKLLTYCQHLVIFPVPPIGGITLAKNTAVSGYNDYLKSQVQADTTGRLHWIDDCADLVDGSGAVKAGYMHPTDELHPFPPGMYRMALTALPQLQSLFGAQTYTSGISTDAADVYPAQPQWVGNHVNAGSAGTLGAGITGTAPTGWDVTCSSGAACAVSIVAADGGDSNTVPWLRFTPSAGIASGYIGADITGGGAAVTSATPLDIEQIAEIRFNSVDATKIAEVNLALQVGGFFLPKDARIRVDGWNESTITRTWKLRKATHRKDNNAGGGSTVRNKFVIQTNAFSGGGAGSVDVRCYTNRTVS